MTAVKVGLIGYGLFGRHHGRCLAETPGAELAAIAVPSEASREAARRDHPSADVFSDYRDMLDHCDLDAVVIVAPNQWHASMAKAALQAGKHVLLEKPMAFSVAECDELIALADRQKKVLAIGHELRLSSLWGGVRELIEQGAIGRPLYALIDLLRFPYRSGSDNWRYDPARVGNWILEEPIHFFDLARWYLGDAGEPVSVYARANGRDESRPALTDNFSAVVNFPGSAFAVITQTLSGFGHHQTAKITGTEGAIWAAWSASDARSDKPVFSLRYGLGDVVSEQTFDRPTGELLELADEIKAFIESIARGTPPPCTGEDGRWSTLLCLAAQQSVERGGIIEASSVQ